MSFVVASQELTFSDYDETCGCSSEFLGLNRSRALMAKCAPQDHAILAHCYEAASLRAGISCSRIGAV
jgi:hypothetical protein